MSPKKLDDARAAGKRVRRLAYTSAALFFLLATNVPSFGQTPGRKLIVTAAGARVLGQPDRVAKRFP